MDSTRERILAEATRQLTDLGYDAFTMAAVRDALGLSSGSMFHAFESKPALAAAVYVEGMAAYQSTALRLLAQHRSPQRALRALIDNHLGWIADHRTLARYLFSTLPEEVLLAAAPQLERKNDAFYAELSALFARATEAGLMRKLERSVGWSLSIGPAHEYGRMWARDGVGPSPRALSTMFQDAAMAALGATLPSRARAGSRGHNRKQKEKK